MAVQPPLLYSIAHTHAYQNIDMHMNTHNKTQQNTKLCGVKLCCPSCKSNHNVLKQSVLKHG